MDNFLLEQDYVENVSFYIKDQLEKNTNIFQEDGIGKEQFNKIIQDFYAENQESVDEFIDWFFHEEQLNMNYPPYNFIVNQFDMVFTLQFFDNRELNRMLPRVVNLAFREGLLSIEESIQLNREFRMLHILYRRTAYKGGKHK